MEAHVHQATCCPDFFHTTQSSVKGLGTARGIKFWNHGSKQLRLSVTTRVAVSCTFQSYFIPMKEKRNFQYIKIISCNYFIPEDTRTGLLFALIGLLSKRKRHSHPQSIIVVCPVVTVSKLSLFKTKECRNPVRAIFQLHLCNFFSYKGGSSNKNSSVLGLIFLNNSTVPFQYSISDSQLPLFYTLSQQMKWYRL